MKAGKKELLSFLFFLLVWILPMGYSGLFNKDVPFFPRTLCYLQKISRLFTHSIESWQIFYLQARPENSEKWITLDETDYFRLKPFGYRTRLHQILAKTKDAEGFRRGENTEKLRHKEIARWVARRYAELYPDKPRIEQIRIVCAFHNVAPKEDIKGRWFNRPLNAYSHHQKKVLYVHNVGEDT